MRLSRQTLRKFGLLDEIQAVEAHRRLRRRNSGLETQSFCCPWRGDSALRGRRTRIPTEPAGTGLGSCRAAADPWAPVQTTAEPCRVRGGGSRPCDRGGGPAFGKTERRGSPPQAAPSGTSVRPSRSHPIGPSAPRDHVAPGGGGGGTRAATCSWLALR